MHRANTYYDDDSKDERPQNPRTNANLFEISTFGWMFHLFKLGNARDLTEDDLYTTLSDHKSSRLGDEFEIIWKSEMTNAVRANRNPSLLKALTRMFGAKYAFYGFLFCINEMVFKLVQPLFIGGLLTYFDPDSDADDSGYAYICASGLVSTMFISIFLHRLTQIEMQHCGMKMRVTCCSMIFRKALSLSHASLGKTTIGQVVNLLSNDVNRFDFSLFYTHFLWIGPLQTVVVTYLLWQEIGVSSLLGISTFLFFIPLQGWMGKKISVYRSKTVRKTDERIRLMNEIISSIRLIKMYTWEKSFAKLIERVRIKEIREIRKSSYIRIIILSFKVIQTKIQLFIAIMSYVVLGNYISARKIFVMISYLNLLQFPMTSWFVQGLAERAELQVTIKRIQQFLLLEEKESVLPNRLETEREVENTSSDDDVKSNGNAAADGIGVHISNATAKWTETQTKNCLENIDLTLEPGKLVAIIGPVGAGKSSLIQLILRELPVSGGTVSVRGVVSYASQEPWLFAGSVRQNILFDSPMDDERYDRVIELCAIKTDLEQFPRGDGTIVGERGVTLSGGQKARISLARAIYKKADIYLLDDPLSAVDSRVGKHLFEKCIKSYLKEKTCLLVTHQLQYLTNVEQIVLMESANISAKGSYRELQASGFDFAKLLGSSAVETSTESAGIEAKNKINKTLTPPGSNRSINSSDVVETKKTDVLVEREENANSRSPLYVKNVYLSYLTAAGTACKIAIFFFMFIFTQIIITGGDYWLSVWIDHEEHDFRNANISSTTDNGTSMTTLRVSSDNELPPSTTNDRQVYVLVYVVLIASMVLTILIRSASTVSVCMRASINLHNTMFNAIVGSTLRFFDTSSSGQIFNRFSNDIGTIDGQLPLIICDTLQVYLVIFGIVFVVSLVNIYLIIPTIIIGIICCFLRCFFMPTSRSLMQLEGTTRSPIFAHMNASLQGLTTIRAFKVEHKLTEEFDKYQDSHSSAYYLFISSNEAFGLWLDVVSTIYLSIVIFSFLVIDNNFRGGFVGLAITQTMRLVLSVQWAVRQSGVLENQMNSVERVLEYTDIPQEANNTLFGPNKTAPTKEWPHSGDIEFRNVYLRYSPDLPYTLKNLNFHVQSMEKVGIVGRTGAGKSSIISALFRLAINEGHIIIDGIEIHDLELRDLRSKFAIIPQEPVLFSGTIRTNLDPFDEHPDHVLWNGLEEVELKVVIENLPGGLNARMSESGSNFSVGQRQLLCLARAIVRNNKILVLDEATANVDPQTDALIQNTIRNKFQERTVLIIAHRLNTIIDSDKVLVMDAGSVVEFDHPYNLLKNKNGHLYKMIEQTGQATADLLKRVAAESYLTMQTKRNLPI